MEFFAIPKPLAIAIGNYLSARPWSEVNGLLIELQQIAPLPAEKTEEKKPESGINAEGGNE